MEFPNGNSSPVDGYLSDRMGEFSMLAASRTCPLTANSDCPLTASSTLGVKGGGQQTERQSRQSVCGGWIPPPQAPLSRSQYQARQGRSAHTSQRCPPGSSKFAVRIPHDRSIGPL